MTCDPTSQSSELDKCIAKSRLYKTRCRPNVHPTRQLTSMSHQFSIIKHSSYYLYHDVIYLDYTG